MNLQALRRQDAWRRLATKQALTCATCVSQLISWLRQRNPFRKTAQLFRMKRLSKCLAQVKAHTNLTLCLDALKRKLRLLRLT